MAIARPRWLSLSLPLIAIFIRFVIIITSLLAIIGYSFFRPLFSFFMLPLRHHQSPGVREVFHCKGACSAVNDLFMKRAMMGWSSSMLERR